MGSGKQVEELGVIAAEASRAALAEQADALGDLRARAGTLLAAASLTVSFLGGQALEREGLGLPVWGAIGAFAVSLLASLYLLRPNDGLVFALDGPELYVELWDVRDDPSELHRRLAYWMGDLRVRNSVPLRRFHTSFRIASIALMLQVALWSLHLSSIM